MANLGEFSEIINSNNLTLLIGADTFITLQDLQLHIGRPESRKAVTGGLIYTYGKGDNWFTATLIATTPELEDTNATNFFTELTQQDANGALTSVAFLIKALDISGASKTFAATGVLRSYDLRKGVSPNSVEIDIDVRITDDTITVT